MNLMRCHALQSLLQNRSAVASLFFDGVWLCGGHVSWQIPKFTKPLSIIAFNACCSKASTWSANLFLSGKMAILLSEERCRQTWKKSPSPPQMDQNSCGRSVEVLWAIHSSHSTSVAKVAQAMLAQGGRVNVEVWGPSLNSLNDVVTFCHCHVILYLSLRLSDLSVWEYRANRIQ